jgi:hypothetical protein
MRGLSGGVRMERAEASRARDADVLVICVHLHANDAY